MRGENERRSCLAPGTKAEREQGSARQPLLLYNASIPAAYGAPCPPFRLRFSTQFSWRYVGSTLPLYGFQEEMKCFLEREYMSGGGENVV